MKNSNPSGVVGLLLITLVLASCAATEPARAPAPVPVQSVAATAAAAASARPEFPGFKLVVRGGEEMYCQTRSPTGSRARRIEACYTREQMTKMAQNNDDYFKQAAGQGSHDSLSLDSPR